MSVPLTFSEALNVSAMTVRDDDDDGSLGIRSVPTQSFYDFPTVTHGEHRQQVSAATGAGEDFGCRKSPLKLFFFANRNFIHIAAILA